MSAKKIFFAVVLLVIAAWLADAVMEKFFAMDDDFQRAEQILREDSRFQDLFGGDAELRAARKTVVNRSPPAESYVQLEFQARRSAGSSSSRVAVRIYGDEVDEPRYELEFR